MLCAACAREFEMLPALAPAKTAVLLGCCTAEESVCIGCAVCCGSLRLARATVRHNREKADEPPAVGLPLGARLDFAVNALIGATQLLAALCEN